ncbi:MAG TPA: hypothetical protein VI072_19690 [Polyangiaceae bacterium]
MKSLTKSAASTSSVPALAGGDRPVARIGVLVDVLLPPTVPFAGTYNGNPISGMMVMTAAGIGVIKTGSDKVKSR